ncbi:ATP-binding protein [Chitinimonas sp. BJYL2]|uniref:ATP-binding protein n=1 Tax=Chitinimonas sp. BJYL2 TaxID=2976696 RepID=UPI0022B360A5|nr:ATP-binding protein [Chitinimonas sp. BJYL2]
MDLAPDITPPSPIRWRDLPSVRRLLTLYLALCGVVLALLGYALFALRQQALAEEETDLANLAHVLAEQTRHSVQSADLLLQATRGHIQDRLQRREGINPVALHRLLRERLTDMPQIRFLAVTDAKGIVIGHSLTPEVGFSVADSTAYRAFLTGEAKGLYVGAPRQSRVDGRWGIGLSVALRDSHGEFAGVLSASFDPAYQAHIYRSIDLGDGSAITLLRSDGVLLARWPETPGTIGRSFAHGEVLTTVLRQKSQGILRSQSPVDGVLRLGYAQRLEGYPFVVTLSRAESAILSNWYRTAWISLLGTGMALLVLGLLTLRLARQARHQRLIEMAALAQAERLRAIDVASPVALIVADRAGVCHYANAVLTQLIPAFHQQLPDNWLVLIDERDIGYAQAQWNRVFDEGIDIELECRLKSTDASARWIHVHAAPLRDADPIVLCVAAVGDITRRREQDHRLEEALTMQRAILDGTSYAIISTDVDGTIQSFNRGAERMLGYRSAEVVGRVSPKLIHDLQEVAERAEALTAELGYTVEPGFEVFVAKARAGGPDEREWTYVRKDGTRIPVLLSVTALRDESGRLHGYLGVAHDLTELHGAARIKREFISIVSHELRTPLTSIRGALGLVASGIAGDLPERARELTQIALQNAERLVRLINDILDIEKIESGRLTLDMRRHNLIPLLERAIADNQGYASHYQVELKLLCPLVSAWAEVDANRIEQVMANLLSNAAKFSTPGTTVEVSVACYARRIRVEVSDHGPGIAPAMRARLFEKFSQIDASDARKRDGTGLGLAITRSLIEGMQGQLGVISDLGAGSCFWFELALEPQSDPGLPVEPARVLILQPHADDALALARQAQEAGYLVEVSYRSEEASRRWLSGRFQLLLMDPAAIAYDPDMLSKLFPGYRHRCICMASSWPSQPFEHCVWMVRPLAAETIAEALRDLSAGLITPTPSELAE